MALKRLSVHYTKIINDDRVPIDFDIVRKEDREKKCIACYINGFYLKNNLDLWKLHKNGQNVYKCYRNWECLRCNGVLIISKA